MRDYDTRKQHHAVIDLEMCKVFERDKKYGRKMEIIQIGVALLDQDFNIISRFDKYVKPSFGRLDYFISNLTGTEEWNITVLYLKLRQ